MTPRRRIELFLEELASLPAEAAAKEKRTAISLISSSLRRTTGNGGRPGRATACQFCGELLPSGRQAAKHCTPYGYQAIEPGGLPTKCPICCETLPSQRQAAVHCSALWGGKPEECADCGSTGHDTGSNTCPGPDVQDKLEDPNAQWV